MTNERANKYSGPCHKDGRLVPAGEGVALQSLDGKWHVYHRQCAQPQRGDHDGWHKRPMLSLDTETTGKDKATARVICVGIVHPDDSEQRWYPKTVDSIPPASSEIHHIYDADLREKGQDPAKAFAEVARVLSEAIAGRVLVVAFNASYDLALLYREFRRYGVAQPDWSQLRVVDPWVLHHVADPTRQSRKLTDLAERFEVILENAHDAVEDARAARALAREIGACDSDLAAKATVYITAEQRSQRHRLDELHARAKKEKYVRDPNGWPIEDIPDPTRAVTPPRTGNTGQRWTDEEREQLRREIGRGMGWDEIAASHDRSVSGVWSEAHKRGHIPLDSEPPWL